MCTSTEKEAKYQVCSISKRTYLTLVYFFEHREMYRSIQINIPRHI